jgi:hypothetical protein
VICFKERDEKEGKKVTLWWRNLTNINHSQVMKVYISNDKSV